MSFKKAEKEYYQNFDEKNVIYKTFWKTVKSGLSDK